MYAPTHSHPVARDAFGIAQMGTPTLTMRGFRFAAGENVPETPPAPTPPPTPDPATPPTPPAPGTPPAPTPDPAPATPPPGQEPVGGVPFDQLPKATQDEVRRLRQADKAARESLKDGMTEERRKELGKLLGYEKDEGPADSAALTASVSQLTSTNSDLLRENIVLRTAQDAGAHAGRLLDSLAFRKSIEGLDPAGDPTAFNTAIKEWITAHPEHASTTAPAIPPSSGGTRQQGQPASTPKPGLEGAIASTMGKAAPSA